MNVLKIKLRETRLFALFTAACEEEHIAVADVLQLFVVTGVASFLMTVVIMQLAVMT